MATLLFTFHVRTQMRAPTLLSVVNPLCRNSMGLTDFLTPPPTFFLSVFSLERFGNPFPLVMNEVELPVPVPTDCRLTYSVFPLPCSGGQFISDKWVPFPISSPCIS